MASVSVENQVCFIYIYAPFLTQALEGLNTYGIFSIYVH